MDPSPLAPELGHRVAGWLRREHTILLLFVLYLTGSIVLLLSLRQSAIETARRAGLDRAAIAASAFLDGGAAPQSLIAEVSVDLLPPAEDLSAFRTPVDALRTAPRGTVVHEMGGRGQVRALQLAMANGQGGIVRARTSIERELATLVRWHQSFFAGAVVAGLFVFGLLMLGALRLRGDTPRAARTRPDPLPPSSWNRVAWIVTLCAAIFAFDLRAPDAVAVSIAFVGVIVFSLGSSRARDTWLAAILATTCTAVEPLLSMYSSDVWVALTNDVFSTFAIWTVAVLGLWQKRSTRIRTAAEADARDAKRSNANLQRALDRTAAAEAALRRNQSLLETVSRMARVGGWELSPDTMTPVWSQEVYRIHEVDPSVAPGYIDAVNFYPPEARSVIDGTVREAIESGKSFDVTVPFVTAKGNRRWVRTIGVADRVDGKTVRVSGALQDLTELYEAQQRLYRLTRSSAEGHWEFDYLRRTIWYSAQHAALRGFEPLEREEPLEAYVSWRHPGDVDRLDAALAAHLTNGEPYDVEARMPTSSGEWRWFRCRGSVERGTRGEPIRFGGAIFDIHAEKLAREELRLAERARLEAEQRFARAVDGSSDALFEWNLVTRDPVWYSPRLREMLGYDESDPFPATVRDLMSPEDADRVNAALQHHFDSDEPFEIVFQLPTKSGGTRYIRSRGRSERNAAGRPIRFSGSMQDITVQWQTEQALVAAKEQAGAASHAKSAFLANVSHEIRTPMNGVLGMTELLLDGRLGPVEREYAETIRSSASALLAIINDLLDFSKIEAGKLVLEHISMSVRDCVEEACSAIAVQAANKRLELIVNVSPAVPDHVLGDPHRLRQTLMNLVGNAIKFTSAGEVVVEVAPLASREGRSALYFEIRDTGIGIEPAALEHLFKPFTQADTSTTRYHGGTGLGLSITRHLVELMGGSIAVASKPGVGSTFTLMIPFEIPVVTEQKTPQQPVDFLGKRVLIVDDNATNLAVLRGQLRPVGFQVVSVGSAAAALEQLHFARVAGTAFDVLIVDDQMPDEHGNSLPKRLRAEPGLSAAPLIMLTTLDSSGHESRLASEGFAECLTKPVRRRELLSCIERVLAIATTGLSDLSGAQMVQLLAQGDRCVTPAARRVLVVEDHPVNQQVARRFLERLGCIVTIACNGSEGVAAWLAGPFDLILMDVQMPLMDGLAATREIRAQERRAGRGHDSSRVPIVALTASAMEDERDRCIAAGMDGLLAKPIDPHRLREVLSIYAGLAADARVASPPTSFDTLLQRLDGDREFASALCETFLRSSRAIVTELRKALEDKDGRAVAASAHKLKGGARSVCADELASTAETIERLAPATTDWRHLASRTDDLAEAIEAFARELAA